MMTEAQVGVLRDKMSAIADIALACDAKVGNCDDIEERVKIVHDHAARIALAALAICPPERQADVAAIWKAVEPESKPQYNPFMIGPFSIEHVSSKTVSVAKVKIGERVFSCETTDDGGFCTAMIYDNGKEAVEMTVHRGKVAACNIGVRAMREYIRQLSGTRSGRCGFLPREIAKLEAAQ